MNTPTQQAHTALPWIVTPFLTPHDDRDPLGVYKVEPAFVKLTSDDERSDQLDDSEHLTEAIHAENRANADLIVRAVNSHAELVAALERLTSCAACTVDYLRDDQTIPVTSAGYWRNAVTSARAALARAKGEA